jgi:hypothetical protein
VVYVNAAVQQDVESDHNTPAMAQFALEDVEPATGSGSARRAR